MRQITYPRTSGRKKSTGAATLPVRISPADIDPVRYRNGQHGALRRALGLPVGACVAVHAGRHVRIGLARCRGRSLPLPMRRWISSPFPRVRKPGGPVLAETTTANISGGPRNASQHRSPIFREYLAHAIDSAMHDEHTQGPGIVPERHTERSRTPRAARVIRATRRDIPPPRAGPSWLRRNLRPDGP